MRRRLPVRVVAVMFFIAALTIATLTAAAAETAVRVGLYENPPKIFTNEKGTPDGFFITILEYIAKREQWKLCYVPGTWSQCLDRLERGEIDLMPDVAYTDERAERYDFSEENVFINWSVIYAAPESHIRNIFDLESKKVALMKDAVAAVEFRSLTESFGVSCSSITVDTYEDVFRLIDTEEADAGVVNRLVGSALESAYDVVKTDIVCCPMELRFAAPKRGNPLLLAAIDRHLRTLKQDKQSLYYQQLYRWFEGIERVEYPRWVMILFVIAGVTFLIIATVLVISAVMVRVRTRGLNQEIERHRETAEKLRTSERLLKKTQELTRVGGWEYDVRTGKMVWTDEVYRIHEIPVDPSIDHVAASLKCYGPEGSRVIEEVFRRAVKEGVPYDLDVPFTTARGNRLWIRTIGNPVVEDGAVVRVVGNIMDITDRKNTEDTLRESEYRFRELFENMSSCVAIYEAVDGGEDFIFRDFNRAGESAEGLKREGLIGRRVTEVFPGVRDFGLFEVFRRVWRTGSPEKFPATMYHDDRIVGWRDNYVLRLPSGEVVAIYDDVTDRKRMEEALKESEEKFRTLFDEASDGILIADHVTKKFIEGNRAICSMLGYTKEEIAGLALHDIHLQKDISLVIDTFEKQFKREKIIASEIPVLRKDGSIFYADIGSYPLTFWGTNYLVGIFRDITDRKEAEEAIRESEKKYRDLYDFLPIPVYEMDLEGTITSANLAIYEVFRGTEEDLKNGISVWRLLPPEEVERTKSNIQRLLAGEQVGGVEYTLMRLDGTTFPAIVISRVICYDGRPVGFRGAIVDITAIRQAEEALRESEEQYRALINGMKETVWVIDFDGTIIDVNNTAVTLLGYSKEELLDIGLHGIDSSLAEDDIKTLAQAMLSDTLQIFETTHTAKDGRTFPVEVCSSLVTYRGRQMILSIARDITERKRAEEQIREYSENLERMVEERTEELNRALYDSREARDRIDGILKSVADGLIVTDLHNRVILMNRAAEDLLGVRLSDVIDRSIDYAFIDETLRERIRTTLEKRETGYQFDFEMPGGDEGHPRIMQARTSVIENIDGRCTGIITIIHDVTYEREVDRMKTDFLSTAAHELRTPLTSIRGFSELLMSRDDVTDDERERFLTYINSQSKNLAAIIDDLLDISRIESGRGFTMNRVPTDVGKLARDVASRFEAVSSAHRFDLDFPGEPVELLIDPDKMEQAFTNIFSNAVKYTPGGGVIKIVGEISGDHYQVSVEDEGIGMTPEQAERIFEKFYRADVSTTAVGGTGLGMSIVKHIVEVHGGTVWVESEFGKGTTVRFTVPGIKDQGSSKD